MRNSLHIRRLVKPESAPSLGFRENARKRFGALGIRSVVPELNLHATVMHYHHFSRSIEELATAIASQPDTSGESITNRVIEARAFGQNRLAGTAWFGLALDSPELLADYDYYLKQLGEARSGLIQPHVTLFKATNIGSPDNIAEINHWVEQRMPDIVGLKQVSIRWSAESNTKPAPASRLAS